MSALFDIVYSDPPWSYTGAQDKWGAAAKFYQTHSDVELVELARPPLSARGILFMWTTSAKLATALWLLDQWHLHYRGIGFVWVKTAKNGTPIKAQGVRPSIVKPLTEFVVCGSSVAVGRPLPLSDESIVQTIFAPRREHSRKPDGVHEAIERMYPAVSKLEMFARTTRDGWSCQGDETTMFPQI